MLGSTTRTQQSFQTLLRLARTHKRNGRPASADPLIRQRLADLAIRVETMKLEAYRQLTDTLRGRTPGIAASVSKLVVDRAEPRPRAHRARASWAPTARSARKDPRARDRGVWPDDFMFSLGLIIGGGTSQIQKNIISERGLGMPREKRRHDRFRTLARTRRRCSASAREFLARECPPALVRETAKRADGVPRALYAKMAELGWTGLIVPEAHGGLGLGTLELALVLEELGRVVAPGPVPRHAARHRGARARGHGGAAQKTWLPRLVAGEALGALAYLEESDRHDPAGIALAAQQDARRLSADGREALRRRRAGRRRSLLVAARTKAGSGPRGVRCSSSPRDTPGVRVRPLETIDLTRRVGEVELRRRRRRPHGRVARQEGEGWPLLARLLDLGGGRASPPTASAAPSARSRWRSSTAKVREQFGRPIGSFQALKHMAAEMVAEIEPSRSLVWYAAYALRPPPREAPRAASMAKARLGDVYSRDRQPRRADPRRHRLHLGARPAPLVQARALERGRVRRSDVPSRAARGGRWVLRSGSRLAVS